MVQVYGYAVGKLPDILPRVVTETYDIHAGDDAVAVVSILPNYLLNYLLAVFCIGCFCIINLNLLMCCFILEYSSIR